MSQEVELTPIESNQTADPLEQSKSTDTDLGKTGGVEGTDNPAFANMAEELESNVAPPMTFVDFVPRILEEAISNADAPVYTDFR